MVINCNTPLYDRRGQILSTWGKDQTGQVEYRINNQGFRSNREYNFVPNYAFFGCSSIFGIGVPADQILVAQFPNAHNYGLAGEYTNTESVINLKNFLESEYYTPTVKLIFFWVARDNENIEQMILDLGGTDILHISQGIRIPGAINLMNLIDLDVSETHLGPKTHRLWANTIKLLVR